MTIPTKTALGHEELRSRAQRLGQRHRTILFLVDGRRTVAEVLSLAQQAGAATSHFEDLVRLGLVELPAEPPPPAVPEPAAPLQQEEEAAAEAEDAPQLTSVALDVPAAVAAAHDAPPVVVPPAPRPEPVRLDDAVEPSAAAPAPEGDTDALQPVRELLIDTLRLDAPLFSARMFVRVRNARSTAELIDLVWEIQNHLVRRHAQRELLSLQRARELLGLGNTLVADDSTRPPLDE